MSNRSQIGRLVIPGTACPGFVISLRDFLRIPRRVALPVALFVGGAACAQFDGDNARYRTISLEDLPAALAAERDALLLDVRSEGEFADTSHVAGLNIGHLAGAKHVTNREVGQRLAEIGDHRDKPVFVYCSHSQRSRRVSNLLADSGYTRVVNVNGGLSRYWRAQDRITMLAPMIVRSTTYGILNANRLCELATSRPVFFLDVRPDSLFAPGRMPERTHALGEMKSGIRIPLERLKDGLGQIPRDRAIVIVDEGGDDSPQAAMMLQKEGYKDVHVLFEGLDGLLGADGTSFPCRKDVWHGSVPYSLIPLEHLDTVAILSGELAVIDLRPADEYEGTAKDDWMNMGRLRVAHHFPQEGLGAVIGASGIPKEGRILLVSRTTGDELFAAARALCDMGYTRVSILCGGLWYIRWAAHNLDGQAIWERWVVPYPKGSRP